MRSLYDRIESLCIDKDVSITTMCRAAGINRGNLTDLKMGRQTGLSQKNIEKIANYFEISTDYLLGRTTAVGGVIENDIRLDKIEYALFGEIRELDEEDKKELLRDAKRLRELKELRRKLRE